MKNHAKTLRGMFFLLLAAMVWGTSFVAQDLASDTVGPFTFNACRMLLGGLCLLPLALFRTRRARLSPSKPSKKLLILGGAVCGAVVFFAAYLQQQGIALGTSAGKSGFITAMYVIMVPMAGLFFRKRVRPIVWICVLVAAVGMYCLCLADFSAGMEGIAANFSMDKGDLFTFFCAVAFTAHILVVDHFAPQMDGVLLSCMQFLFAGVLGVICMFLFEQPSWDQILSASGAILYSAVFSCGMGYTFQILGQRTTPPAIASILMCLESVFAVLSDMVWLGTRMTAEEIVGCALMFLAILAPNVADLAASRKPKAK